MSLNSGTGYTVGSPSSATVTVRDNDVAALPVITVSRHQSSVTEGGTVYFRVHSNMAVPANLSVGFSRSQSGSFASWSGSGTVTISSGGTQSGWVSVSTVNDSTDEANGSLTMSLNSGTGYTVGSPSSATVTVRDNDVAALPVITVSRHQSSVTEGGTVYFRVHSNMAVPANLSVGFSRSQSGSFASWSGSGTVTISSGGTQSGWVSVSTVNDSTDEPNGSLTMSLNSGSGYTVGSPSSATVTVYDNDEAPVPVITISRQQSSITEGQTAEWTIWSDRSLPRALTVNTYQSQSGNFASWTGSGTLHISAGGTSATVGMTTVNDTTDEPNGSLTMTLNSGSGYTVGSPSSASVTVYDNDAETTTGPGTTPTITISPGPAVTEGGSVAFYVAASVAPSARISVWLDLSQQGSFLQTTQDHLVYIGAGARGRWVYLYTVNDEYNEWNGSVTAEVKSGTGYTVGSPSSATVTVYDND